MGVKVELNTYKNENIKYPCLMINYFKSCIVLMTASGTGTILWNADPKLVGCFREKHWKMDHFEPYTGTLSLSNEKELF